MIQKAGLHLAVFFFLFLSFFLIGSFFSKPAYAQTCTDWLAMIPGTIDPKDYCVNSGVAQNCEGAGSFTGDECCAYRDPSSYCVAGQTYQGHTYFDEIRCCSNPTPTPTPTPSPTPTPTPTPPAGCQNNADCGTCKQCCVGSPNYCSSWGYYCDGSIIDACWATPPPSASPTPTPTPSPSSSPPICTASLSYNCSVSPVGLVGSWNSGSGSDCNVYIQAGETPHVISSDCSGNNVLIQDSSYIWNGGTYQLFATKPGGCNSSSNPVTINCGGPTPPPPPPPDTPPPYYQVYMEVANKTKLEEIPNDCGEGSCAAQSRWPPTCATLDPETPTRARTIRTTTQARPGDTIEVKLCFRRRGGTEFQKDPQIAVWLNQVFAGNKTLSQAAENFQWLDGDTWRLVGEGPYWRPEIKNETYTYHASFHPDALQVAYNRIADGAGNCGAPATWVHSCAASKSYRFRIKNDPALNDQTASAKASLRLAPYVKPYDYHPYLTACVNASKTGFWERTPSCCWGYPGTDGYPGCPLPANQQDQCRYGSCQGSEALEDFFFWSNWININVKEIKPWIQVTGDVHSNKRINAPGGP